MWRTVLVAATRVSGLCGCSLTTCGFWTSIAGGTPSDDSARNAPSANPNMMPNLPSQMRTALASMASKTGSSSPGELLMTCSTSEVAVCCSSASERSSVRWRNSPSRRVFSMAITAWAAKLVTSSICFSLNGCTS